jgi:hypothetical protein
MSGRVIRQHREAQARLAALPPCVCGYGIREEDGKTVFQCHDMDCQWLIALGRVTRENGKKAFCSQCLHRLRRQSSGGWVKTWCQFGHEHSLGFGGDW